MLIIYKLTQLKNLWKQKKNNFTPFLKLWQFRASSTNISRHPHSFRCLYGAFLHLNIFWQRNAFSYSAWFLLLPWFFVLIYHIMCMNMLCPYWCPVAWLVILPPPLPPINPSTGLNLSWSSRADNFNPPLPTSGVVSLSYWKNCNPSFQNWNYGFCHDIFPCFGSKFF